MTKRPVIPQRRFTVYGLNQRNCTHISRHFVQVSHGPSQWIRTEAINVQQSNCRKHVTIPAYLLAALQSTILSEILVILEAQICLNFMCDLQ